MSSTRCPTQLEAFSTKLWCALHFLTPNLTKLTSPKGTTNSIDRQGWYHHHAERSNVYPRSCEPSRVQVRRRPPRNEEHRPTSDLDFPVRLAVPRLGPSRREPRPQVGTALGQPVPRGPAYRRKPGRSGTQTHSPSISPAFHLHSFAMTATPRTLRLHRLCAQPRQPRHHRSRGGRARRVLRRDAQAGRRH